MMTESAVGTMKRIEQLLGAISRGKNITIIRSEYAVTKAIQYTGVGKEAGQVTLADDRAEANLFIKYVSEDCDINSP